MRKSKKILLSLAIPTALATSIALPAITPSVVNNSAKLQNEISEITPRSGSTNVSAGDLSLTSTDVYSVKPGDVAQAIINRSLITNYVSGLTAKDIQVKITSYNGLEGYIIADVTILNSKAYGSDSNPTPTKSFTNLKYTGFKKSGAMCPSNPIGEDFAYNFKNGLQVVNDIWQVNLISNDSKHILVPTNKGLAFINRTTGEPDFYVRDTGVGQTYHDKMTRYLIQTYYDGWSNTFFALFTDSTYNEINVSVINANDGSIYRRETLYSNIGSLYSDFAGKAKYYAFSPCITDPNSDVGTSYNIFPRFYFQSDRISSTSTNKMAIYYQLQKDNPATIFKGYLTNSNWSTSWIMPLMWPGTNTRKGNGFNSNYLVSEKRENQTAPTGNILFDVQSGNQYGYKNDATFTSQGYILMDEDKSLLLCMDPYGADKLLNFSPVANFHVNMGAGTRQNVPYADWYQPMMRADNSVRQYNFWYTTDGCHAALNHTLWNAMPDLAQVNINTDAPSNWNWGGSNGFTSDAYYTNIQVIHNDGTIEVRRNKTGQTTATSVAVKTYNQLHDAHLSANPAHYPNKSLDSIGGLSNSLNLPSVFQTSDTSTQDINDRLARSTFTWTELYGSREAPDAAAWLSSTDYNANWNEFVTGLNNTTLTSSYSDMWVGNKTSGWNYKELYVYDKGIVPQADGTATVNLGLALKSYYDSDARNTNFLKLSITGLKMPSYRTVYATTDAMDVYGYQNANDGMWAVDTTAKSGNGDWAYNTVTKWIPTSSQTIAISSLSDFASIQSKNVYTVTDAELKTYFFNNRRYLWSDLPDDFSTNNIFITRGTVNDASGTMDVTVKSNYILNSNMAKQTISSSSSYVGNTIKLTGLAPYTKTSFKYSTNQQVTLSSIPGSTEIAKNTATNVTKSMLETFVFNNLSSFFNAYPSDLTQSNVIVSITGTDDIAGTVTASININRKWDATGNLVDVTTASNYVGGTIVLKGFNYVNTDIPTAPLGYNLGISSKTAKAATPEELAKAIFNKDIIKNAKNLTEADVSVESIVPNNPDRSLTATVVISHSKAWYNGAAVATKRITNVKFVGFADIIRTPSSIRPEASSVISSMIDEQYTVDVKANLSACQTKIKTALADTANLNKIAASISINGYTTTVSNVTLVQKGSSDAFDVNITFNNWANDPASGSSGYATVTKTVVIKTKPFNGYVSESSIIHNGANSVDFDAIQKSIDPSLPKDQFLAAYKLKVAQSVYQSIINNPTIPTSIRNEIKNANTTTPNKVVQTINDGITLDVADYDVNKFEIAFTRINLNNINNLVPDKLSFQKIEYTNIKLKNNVNWDIVWIAMGGGFLVVTIIIASLVIRRLRSNTRTRNGKILHR